MMCTGHIPLFVDATIMDALRARQDVIQIKRGALACGLAEHKCRHFRTTRVRAGSFPSELLRCVVDYLSWLQERCLS